MENQADIYRRELPDQITTECFIHKILGYRYHWHDDLYEINILLRGQACYTVCGRQYRLTQHDMIIINPKEGHASLALCDDTVALCIHLSSRSFLPFLHKSQKYVFRFASGAQNRSSTACSAIRCFAAHMILYAHEKNEASYSASFYALCTILKEMLFPQTMSPKTEIKDRNEISVRKIIAYINQHYAEKVTLQELSEHLGYNRTYLSSFFKQNFEIGLYDHLTNVRFSHAVISLHDKNKNLTHVAIENGFPDLRTFNALFKKTFGILPSEYRENNLVPIPLKHGIRSLVSCEATDIHSILSQYIYAI